MQMLNEPSKSISVSNPPFAEITGTGIVFAANAKPSFEEWQNFGRVLLRAHKGIQIGLGDWLNYGARKFGEKYTSAIALTGYDRQTLENIAWIARKVQISARREILSVGHYKVVAKLETEQQVYWLDIAARALEQNQHFGTRRLALSIKQGEIVPNEETVKTASERGRMSYILWITRLAAQVEEWEANGFFARATEDERNRLRLHFERLARAVSILLAHECWPE